MQHNMMEHSKCKQHCGLQCYITERNTTAMQRAVTATAKVANSVELAMDV